MSQGAFELEGEDRWQARRIGPHRASRIRTVTSSLEAFTTGFNLPLLYASVLWRRRKQRLHLRPLSRYLYSLLPSDEITRATGHSCGHSPRIRLARCAGVSLRSSTLSSLTSLRVTLTLNL
jgi:hypothetical protein